VLAIGSDKGSIVFFNRKTQRRIPTISKHGKRVSGGDWNKEGNLITSSDDKLLTVSNNQGDTLHESFICKGDILGVKWCPFRDPSKPKRVCAAIVGGKNMLYLKPEDAKHFMFNFHANYGKATIFEWYGDSRLLIGFSSGMLSLISTRSEDIGQELNAMSTGNSPIETMVINTELNKCATASNGVIRFYDLNSWTEVPSERFEIQKGCGKITKMHWTSDGSIMTITTSSGYFLGFLTVVPSLCSALDMHAALLSSLTEVSVVDCQKSNVVVAKTDLEMEPTFL
jgi:WD repeat-containing protein 19